MVSIWPDVCVQVCVDCYLTVQQQDSYFSGNLYMSLWRQVEVYWFLLGCKAFIWVLIYIATFVIFCYIFILVINVEYQIVLLIDEGLWWGIRGTDSTNQYRTYEFLIFQACQEISNAPHEMSNYCFVTTIYDIFALKWCEYPDNSVRLVQIKL